LKKNIKHSLLTKPIKEIGTKQIKNNTLILASARALGILIFYNSLPHSTAQNHR
jgi:hypothetical protein